MSCCNEDNNCVDPVSSGCVIWQGEDIACLGITKGQTLTTIETVIANKICELSDESDLSDLTLCGDLIALMSGKDKNVANLLQVLVTYNCTLKDLIDELSVNDSLTLDYKCLETTLDPCNPTDFTVQNILQILINNFCDLKSTVDELSITIVNQIEDTIADSVTNMLETCQDDRIVSNNLPGEDRRLTFRGFVPPFCPIAYFGSLSYFDGSGKGLDDDIMCGWYLCNGNNGTPDLRGRVIVCAVQGMGGGTLSADVDPTLPQNTGSNYTLNDTGGKVRHKLTGNESGTKAHTHTVNDPGHNHRVVGMEHNIGGDGGGNEPRDAPNGGQYYYTDTKTTGITIGAYPGEDASSFHENRMPYKAAYYIMMIN
jgi:hypothetical protein